MVRHSLRSGERGSEEPEPEAGMRRSGRIAAVEKPKKHVEIQTSSDEDDDEYHRRSLPKRKTKSNGAGPEQPDNSRMRRSGRIAAVVKEKLDEDEEIQTSTSTDEDDEEYHCRTLPKRKAKLDGVRKIETLQRKSRGSKEVRKSPRVVSNPVTNRQTSLDSDGAEGKRRSSRLSGVINDAEELVEMNFRKPKSKNSKYTLDPKSNESESGIDQIKPKVISAPDHTSDIVMTRTRRVSGKSSTTKCDPSNKNNNDEKDQEAESVPQTAEQVPPESNVDPNPVAKDDSKNKSSENGTSSGPKTDLDPANNPAVVGKLRSSVADMEAKLLARNYCRSLEDMEEYSLNFLTQEVHHPVITCFRELTRTDISTIVGSAKLRKSCNRLELSYLYLGLIDLLATVNNNPFYGENCNAKFSKNVSITVKKVLVELKNIIGTWALSGNEHFTKCASLILQYLRRISPMFAKAGFESELIQILDCIEGEITRLKSNHEKLKQVGLPSTSSSSKPTESKSSLCEDVERGALNEIVLNLNLLPKVTESEDEDVTVIDENTTKSFEIFGKPLKGSSNSLNSNKKTTKQNSTDGNRPSSTTSSLGSNSSQNDQPSTPKYLSLFSNISETSTLKPGSPKTSSTSNGSVKRSAAEDLTNSESSKKPKLSSSHGSSPVSRNQPTSIRSFFQNAISAASSALSSLSPLSVQTPKPTVNAFTLMMNKSKELAQKKKTDKIPTLNLSTVKT